MNWYCRQPQHDRRTWWYLLCKMVRKARLNLRLKSDTLFLQHYKALGPQSAWANCPCFPRLSTQSIPVLFQYSTWMLFTALVCTRRAANQIWILSFRANILANRYHVTVNNGCTKPQCEARLKPRPSSPKIDLKDISVPSAPRLCFLKSHDTASPSHNLHLNVFCHGYLGSSSLSVS